MPRIRVTAEADPSSLPRVLKPFQDLNLVPRRVSAKFGPGNTLLIQVDVLGVAEERLDLLVAKITQITTVVSAFWHQVSDRRNLSVRQHRHRVA